MGANPTLDRTAAVVRVMRIPAVGKNLSESKPLDVDRTKPNEAATDGVERRCKGTADKVDWWFLCCKRRRGCLSLVVKWNDGRSCCEDG